MADHYHVFFINNVADRVYLPKDINSCLVSEMFVEACADRTVVELITVTVGIDGVCVVSSLMSI